MFAGVPNDGGFNLVVLQNYTSVVLLGQGTVGVLGVVL